MQAESGFYGFTGPRVVTVGLTPIHQMVKMGVRPHNPLMEFALVLTSIAAEGDADAIAKALVDERLAACVSVLPPMQSTYRWKGTVESAAERQLLIKTKAAQVAALEVRVRELHPYEVPEFLVLAIDAGSPAYLSWLRENAG